MSIPFTQYLLPNGRRQAITIDRPEEIEALAKACIERGVRFEIEILRTGEVSLEALCDRGKEDVESLAFEITSNGPTVPEAVDRIVRDAHSRLGAAS